MPRLSQALSGRARAQTHFWLAAILLLTPVAFLGPKIQIIVALLELYFMHRQETQASLSVYLRDW